MTDMIQAVARWNGSDSDMLLTASGVQDFTNMQLGYQKALCGEATPGGCEVLLGEMPPDRACPEHVLWYLEAKRERTMQFIKDLCSQHRGEVREMETIHQHRGGVVAAVVVNFGCGGRWRWWWWC